MEQHQGKVLLKVSMQWQLKAVSRFCVSINIILYFELFICMINFINKIRLQDFANMHRVLKFISLVGNEKVLFLKSLAAEKVNERSQYTLERF